MYVKVKSNFTEDKIFTMTKGMIVMTAICLVLKLFLLKFGGTIKSSLDIQHLEPNEDSASQDCGSSHGLPRCSETMLLSQDLTSDILDLYMEPT